MLQHIFKNIITKGTLSVVAVAAGSLLFTQVSLAATLSISPSSVKVSVGDIVPVKVVVDTTGSNINSSDAVVRFPTDMLDVVSVSKSSSIFTLWVEDPKFSNPDGTVTFDGGLPNPGYTGSNGQVLSIIFKAKKAGTASIVFADAAVRQNDGLGTDILTAKQSGSVSIKVSELVEVVPVDTTPGSPLAPIVTSITHPDQNKWYSSSTVQLKWSVPKDVTAVSTSIGHSPASLPTVTSPATTVNKTFNNLYDGVWYFNIRFKNKNGWGEVTHFKIQIDTIPPDAFKITFPHGDTTSDPRPVVYFNTTDETSGVQYYEVKIGEKQFQRLTIDDVSSNPYTPDPQDPGEHNILVRAVDYAGNETVQSGEFTVVPINSPIITDYPSELSQGDLLRIRGTSYPLTDVEVVVTDANGHSSSQLTNVQGDGNFGMIWAKNLETGAYTITARAIDKHEAKSQFTKPLSMTVKKSALVSVGSFVVSWLSLIVLLVICAGGIGLLITYFIHKGGAIKKSVRRDAAVAESSVHKAFDLLRDNVREQIKTLEKAGSKRELTKEEEKVIKKLQENLTKSEEYLEKEIANIEKKVS